MALETGTRVRVKRGASTNLAEEHVGQEGVLCETPDNRYDWGFRPDGTSDVDFEDWGGLALYEDEIEVLA